MARIASEARRARARLYFRLPALLWSWAFAAVHAYWLLGGSIGLPSDVTIAPGSALFYAAFIAVPLLLGAGLLAIRGERWIGTKRSLLLLLVVLAFCFIHSTWPLTLALVTVIKGDALGSSEREFYALLYEINWFAGGVWFALAIAGLRSKDL